jgi:hypothetical protein
MKKYVLHILALFTIVSTLMLSQSCSTDHYKEIGHKWRIVTDEVTLELHQDSTFILTQRNIPITGSWKLEDHGKSIIFKEKGKSEKKLKIKELSDTKLILSDNGYELDYVRAD